MPRPATDKFTDVIETPLKERADKLIAKAPQIATEEQLGAILASFPEKDRAALCEKVKPLLGFELKAKKETPQKGSSKKNADRHPVSGEPSATDVDGGTEYV